MHLHELIAPENLVTGFEPVDKWDAIHRLVDRLGATGRISTELIEPILDAVLDRERSMSTGMEDGIAIPHAAVDGIEDVAASMGIVTREEGIAFESIDGQPARLVVLLVIPRAQKLLHIRTLADVARVLSRESVRSALSAAPTADEAHEALKLQEAPTT